MESKSKQFIERDLVLYQLLSSDPKLVLSVGTDHGMRSYTRDQIIQHVKALDEIGQDYIDTQMNFMRAVSSGKMFEQINEQLKSI